MLTQIADIHTVNGNASLCCVIKTWNQVNEGGFSRTGTSDKGSCFTRFRCKADIFQDICVRTVITEGNVLKLNNTFHFFAKVFFCSLFRICNLVFGGQDLTDTISRYRCSWYHNEHHADEQEAHDNMHCILDECHHIADLKIALCDLFAAKPNDKQRDTVHNKHHGWHHSSHCTVYKQGILGQIFVCFVKAFLHKVLICKRAHNHNTGKFFTADKV